VRFWVRLVFLASVALAQDERLVTSPNGQIALSLFIATQDSSNLSRIAYAVSFRGQPILKTSYLGLDILGQEPMLGENVGLTSSSSSQDSRYNSLIAKYMQNGSLGRLIDIEVRAYDDGVAFRYVIPPSTPLTEILIAEEATEFRFAQETGADPVVHVGAGWVSITESKPGSYPPMRLTRWDQTTQLTRLSHKFEGTTPLTCPWRIIAIGPSREGAVKSAQLLLLGLPGR